MEKLTSVTDLRAAILELEIKQAEQGKLLKEQFHLVYESVKPLNLIKSTFKEAIASADIKEDVINSTVGLTAGYISKAVFEGVTRGPLRKLLGTALMFGIKTIVAKNPDAVKSIGEFIFKKILHKKEKNTDDSN
jgi:hypothetical protein